MYRSHTGKTKDDETFEKFLGKTAYDEFLVPFKRFLPSSFCEYNNNKLQWLDLRCFKAPTDCTLCSLSKDKPEDFEGDISNDEWKLKNAEEENRQLATDRVTNEDSNAAGSDNAKVHDQVSETSSKGTNEYVRNNAKNIAKLQGELNNVNAQHLLSDELKQKPVSKKSAKKKGKVQGDEVVWRESKWVLLWPLWRYTDRRLLTSFFRSSNIPATSVPTSTSALVESVNGAKEPTKSAIPVTIHADNQDFTQNSTGPTSTSQEPPTSPVSPLDEAQSIEIAPLTVDSASTFVANLLPPVIPESAIDSVASASVVKSPACVDLEPTEIHSHSHSSSALDSNGDSTPSGAPVDQSTESVQPTAKNRGNGDADVIMADDMNLPAYLTGMIGYLCRVAADRAWQDLVMHFVAFEKTGQPTNGVSAL